MRFGRVYSGGQASGQCGYKESFMWGGRRRPAMVDVEDFQLLHFMAGAISTNSITCNKCCTFNGASVRATRCKAAGRR
jgi:hypothetical protein